jgi:acyl-CoA synthetase (AMP-forming)/AMP-acid ligase II
VHLSEIARAAPDRPAVVMSDGSRAVTFADLDRRSLQVSRLLSGLGVQTGGHVALMMANRPEFFEIAWGAQRHGTYWTPVNWHLTAPEAQYIVEDCGAQVLFAAPETADVAAQIAERLPRVTVVGVGGERPGLASYERAVAGLSSDPLPGEVEGIPFLYSSGTTGRPKGIKRQHDFPPFGAGLGLEQLMQGAFGFGPDTTYLCPAPLYHAAPIGWSLGTHRLGGTVVVMERFDATECLRAIERHRVTHVQFVPTHFVRMLKLPEAQRRAFDLSSLQVVVHAAAPCPVDVKRQMIDWLGPKIAEYYAGSEGNGMTMIGSADWLAHPGSVGRPVIGALHIMGGDGEELPPGQDGMIYFEGAPFEYHNDPAKTASSRNGRGWSTLGDMGHLDADGYLFLADRRTDLIISGGVNIYPAEIEEALITHPAVVDVAVIGVPDPEMGQSVLAVVQPAGDGPPRPGLADELIAHCRSRLASFKCPRTIEFTRELPRLPTGKLLRRQLRAERADRQPA